MAVTVHELAGADGQNVGISQEEGSADVTYHLSGANETTPPTPAELTAFEDLMCGGVLNLAPKVVRLGTDTNAGKVWRQLPPVHARRPELSAAGVTSVTAATEQHTAANAVTAGTLNPVTATFPNALAYRARVKFVKRPYFLLPNDRIAVNRDTYYPPDGSTGVPIYYAEEYRRYCKVTRKPSPDTVSATHGSFRVRTQTGTAPPTGVNGVQAQGQPFMFLQNQSIEVQWFLVPARYFSDFTIDGVTYRSYLARFVNTVNQLPITIAGHTFPAGSLMYQGSEPDTFIPASPDRQKFLGALSLGLDQNLLMNVKMKFWYTAREGTDVPNSAHALLTNKNNIAAGHNLVPEFSSRTFRYVVIEGSGADSTLRPPFQSFPFQLLFTDPLLAQTNGPI